VPASSVFPASSLFSRRRLDPLPPLGGSLRKALVGIQCQSHIAGQGGGGAALDEYEEERRALLRALEAGRTVERDVQALRWSAPRLERVRVVFSFFFLSNHQKRFCIKIFEQIANELRTDRKSLS